MIRWTLEMVEANQLKRAQERLRNACSVRTVQFDTSTPLKVKRVQFRDTNASCLADQVVKAGLPKPSIEHKFAISLGRKHRSDLAWPELKFAIEVQGQVHMIKGKFRRDIEKSQLYLQLGWKVLLVTPKQARNGEALELLRPHVEKETQSAQ
jgi:hypothetical protein